MFLRMTSVGGRLRDEEERAAACRSSAYCGTQNLGTQALDGVQRSVTAASAGAMVWSLTAAADSLRSSRSRHAGDDWSLDLGLTGGAAKR